MRNERNTQILTTTLLVVTAALALAQAGTVVSSSTGIADPGNPDLPGGGIALEPLCGLPVSEALGVDIARASVSTYLYEGDEEIYIALDILRNSQGTAGGEILWLFDLDRNPATGGDDGASLLPPTTLTGFETAVRITSERASPLEVYSWDQTSMVWRLGPAPTGVQCLARSAYLPGSPLEESWTDSCQYFNLPAEALDVQGSFHVELRTWSFSTACGDQVGGADIHLDCCPARSLSGSGSGSQAGPGSQVLGSTGGIFRLIQYGDCNDDGQRTVVDALLAAQVAVGLGQFEGEQLLRCDVDGNPGITVLDALEIAQAAVGL